MPTSCSAPGCTQRFVKDSGVRFFRFPKEKERRLKWLLAIGRRSLSNRQHVKLWEPSDHDCLCSMHFAEGTPSKDHYHQDYIPSVFSFATTAKQPEQTPARADRFKRLQRRRIVLTPNDKENHQPANDQDEIAEALLMTLSTLIEELDNLKADYTSLQKDHQRLMCENRDLKEQIKKTNFSYKNLGNREVSTLTGLQSMTMFTWLLATVSDVIKPTGKLCRGNVLLMVLMKLKLNLTNNDLAMRFQTCPTQLLELGDLVLADRGFLIADELAAHGASLPIPPFAKGKSQFSQREVECVRRLSKSRIYVERAIECVKRFQILKNTLPISLIRHADSILTICAAFTNLLPKLVK
ncbi:LOW QUALITY PROTEIN: THAP2-like protein [Mya arenaria]|uniref:THAP2-like protein n=1 Tax=Mya arenaria TaxID=6604 RepID=A0ABY7EDM4_MYAAR|nr:LOW QUALITY PROTEIN: THAP2-like protein [Mya arenaria]